MITNLRETVFDGGTYLKPVKILYSQKGNERSWEAVKSLDSVAALLFHKEKDAFLLVKQFRAPIAVNKGVEDAFTYELCAGICDKNITLEETICEEIDEECGYMVTAKDIKHITSFYTCVGISGAMQTLFYAEINDNMQIHDGGGDHTEDIELVWLPRVQAKDFILDAAKPKTPGVIAAIYWFFNTKENT